MGNSSVTGGFPTQRARKTRKVFLWHDFSCASTSLQWRHMSIMACQITGIHRWPVGFPLKGPENAIVFPWHDFSCAFTSLQWRHMSIAASQITGNSTVLFRLKQRKPQSCPTLVALSDGNPLVTCGSPSQKVSVFENRFYTMTSPCLVLVKKCEGSSSEREGASCKF